MSVTIGIFEQEQAVIEAIKRLDEAGFDKRGLRVIVNNHDAAPVLMVQSDVPVEDIYAIQATKNHEGGDGDTTVGAIPLGSGYPVGNSFFGNGPVGAIFIRDDDHPGIEEVLHDIGIPDQASGICRDAVEIGHYLLMIEAEVDTKAASLLHDAGAINVVQ